MFSSALLTHPCLIYVVFDSCNISILYCLVEKGSFKGHGHLKAWEQDCPLCTVMFSAIAYKLSTTFLEEQKVRA